MNKTPLLEEYPGNDPVIDIGVFSTGSLLEDLDNLLTMYKNITDTSERQKVYNEFWDKYRKMVTSKRHLLLQIPSIVRGSLAIMYEDGQNQGLKAYKRDRIMRMVLSRNGLFEEPQHVPGRYLFSYFIEFEVFNYMKWFISHCNSIQAWMFFFLSLLMLAETLHIAVDFSNGAPWRALLMQCLVPLTFIAAIQFVNTPFTANILRVLIENKCAALCTVNGRIALNSLVIFFNFASLKIEDLLLLFCAMLCGICTIVIFVSFSRFKHVSHYARIATENDAKLQERFEAVDRDQDGVLNHEELMNFFQSYNQMIPMTQIELMVSQYDLQRDNGLRFDALHLWYNKLPINHSTRKYLLSSKTLFDSQ